MSEKPRATVREVDGQLVLDDPDAVEMIRAVAKHNCKNTLVTNQDHVEHFMQRIAARKLNATEVVIVILNVDDLHGGPLADALMPGFDWQAIRDRDEVPFARGLAGREGIQETLALFDREAADKLATIAGVAVVVVDHGVADVWEYNQEASDGHEA